jgi:hypothetical protein
MRKITAEEFLNMVAKNPSVFEHWDTPLEITEYVDCEYSPITHLSKHLTFSGRSESGEAAKFFACRALKIATGTFHGLVNFSSSSIEMIENLTVTQPEKDGWAADFHNCKKLKVATGTYAGSVFLLGSGIHSIKNLNIEQPDNSGTYAAFSNCPNLKTLEGWDLSKKIVIESKKLEEERKRRQALKDFHKKAKAEELPFL